MSSKTLLMVNMSLYSVRNWQKLWKMTLIHCIMYLKMLQVRGVGEWYYHMLRQIAINTPSYHKQWNVLMVILNVNLIVYSYFVLYVLCNVLCSVNDPITLRGYNKVYLTWLDLTWLDYFATFALTIYLAFCMVTLNDSLL